MSPPVMRKFSNHVVLSIKDQMRGVRYFVRHGAYIAEGGPFEVPQPVASVAGIVFAQVEAAASAFLNRPEDDEATCAFPLPVEAYFGHPDDEVARGRVFTRAFYSALKALLRKFGARQFLIFEHAIEEARAALLLRHGDLIWATLGAKNGAREERVTRLCAAIVCEMAARRPIKQMDINPGDPSVPKHLLAAPNAYCLLVMGLATAIASLRRDFDEGDAETIGVAADMTVDARYARFSAALRDRDPVGALTREFAKVIPFLP